MDKRQQIKDKFIENLQFEGWNQQAIEKAAKDCGLEDGYVRVLYPGGIEEFTKEFADSCNIEALEKAKAVGLDKLRTTQKVEEIIFQRINTYHTKLGMEGLKKFMAYAANPAHLGSSLKNIYEFSSDVWYLMGDKSTNFSYYTKRLSLSALYTKCVLYSLSDKSNNMDSTRKFIQKSIDGLMKINKLKQKLNDFITNIPLKTKR